MPVRTLSRVLTTAIVRLEDDLLTAVDAEEARRTASALATLAGVYANVTKAHNFEEELTKVASELAEVRKELHDNRTAPRQPQAASAGTETTRIN